MATREELTIAMRVLAYLNNCQRDMRLNAQSYLAEIAAGHPRLTTEQLGVVLKADGAQVSRLMVKLADFVAVGARQTKLQNGLTFFGITLGQANSDRLMIKDAADVQAAANVVNDAAITDAANATLAALPAIDTID